MDDNILKNLVRIGTVSSVDNGAKKARVIFQDKNMTSGWLFVLQHPGAVTVEEAGNHSHTVLSTSTSTDGKHVHEASGGIWMPKVNDTVLVLYLPVFNGDGFILGVI